MQRIHNIPNLSKRCWTKLAQDMASFAYCTPEQNLVGNDTEGSSLSILGV
jgi:hypothetical protein